MKKIFPLIFIFIVCGCSQNEPEPIKNLYGYTSTVATILEDKPSNYNKEFVDQYYELKSKYILGLENFNPTEPDFSLFIGSYPHDGDGYRHVIITEDTRIYRLNDNEKTVTDIYKFEGQAVKLWVYVQPEYNYKVIVDEIILVD